MGDLSCVSFNRAVSDEEFTRMLETVVEDEYSQHYEVEYLSKNYWVVRPKAGILTEEDGYTAEQLENGDAQAHWAVFFRRATNYSKKVNGNWPLYKGKFGHETPPVGNWGWWFTDQLHGHLANKFNATSTHESCAGSWKCDPAKLPTFSDWLCSKRCYRENSATREILLKEIPVKLRSLRG